MGTAVCGWKYATTCEMIFLNNIVSLGVGPKDWADGNQNWMTQNWVGRKFRHSFGSEIWGR